jgi:hypothetical protein
LWTTDTLTSWQLPTASIRLPWRSFTGFSQQKPGFKPRYPHGICSGRNTLNGFASRTSLPFCHKAQVSGTVRTSTNYPSTLLQLQEPLSVLDKGRYSNPQPPLCYRNIWRLKYTAQNCNFT